MFLTDHFLKEFCKPLSKEHSFKKKKNNAIQLGVWEEKMFKGSLLRLPWQPEFFTKHNRLKDLKEDHLRNIPVKFGKYLVHSF